MLVRNNSPRSIKEEYKMTFEKYTTEDLTNSLKTLKELASSTGELYYLSMIIGITEELNKRA